MFSIKPKKPANYSTPKLKLGQCPIKYLFLTAVKPLPEEVTNFIKPKKETDYEWETEWYLIYSADPGMDLYRPGQTTPLGGESEGVS